LGKTPKGRPSGRPSGPTERIAELEQILKCLKGTESALLEYAELVCQFYDAIPIPCVSLDRTSRILRANSAWLELLGYSHPEVMGRRLTDLLLPASKPTFRKALRLLKSGREVPEVQVEVRKRDAKYLTARCAGRGISDHRGDVILAHLTFAEQHLETSGVASLHSGHHGLLTILGALNDGVNIIGRNHDMLYVNPVLERAHGPWAGKKCYQFFRNRRTPCAPCRIAPAVDGVPLRREVPEPSGNRIYEVIDTPIETPDGDAAVLEVARDITVRKQAQRALERERRAFKAVAEAALRTSDVAGLCKDALVGLAEILGFERGVVRLYDREQGTLIVTATTGLSPEEVAAGVPDHKIGDRRFVAAHVAKTLRPVFAPNVPKHPVYRRLRQRFKETGVKSIISWPICSSAGELLGVIHLISHTPMDIPVGDRAFFEAVAGMFGIALDRKLAEQALEASERAYRGRFENSPIALWEEDFSGVRARIDQLRASGIEDFKAYFESHPDEVIECAALVRLTDANRASLDLYGARTIEELAGISLENIKHWTFEQFRDVLVAIASGLTCLEMGYTTRTARGEERFLQARWAAAPGYEDDLSKIQVSVVDLTQRKLAEDTARRAEAQLRSYSEDLENMVTERTARISLLERQRSESEKIAATGRMAARVAHEINNPLAGIKNSFQLLKLTMDTKHAYYPYAVRLEREIDRIAGIVRRMFDLYSTTETENVEIALGETIKGVVAIMETTCKANGIELKTILPDNLGIACLPKGYLSQILFNLIQNSVEASVPGDSVEVRGSVVLDDLAITVKDHGGGIDPKIAHRVFEPFFTTKDSSTSTGLGLGLSVSKGMVEAMGGTLTFESKPAEGTTFTLVLPMNAPDHGTSL
jgi:two-component system sporulation sensor kinase C